MLFSAYGLIISSLQKGEKSALVKVFTPLKGLIWGYVKNIYNKNKINIFSVGNLIHFHSYGREGGLLTIVGESQFGGIYACMDNKTGFNSILALCSIIDILMIIDSDHDKDSSRMYRIIEGYINKVRLTDNRVFIIANLLLTIKEFYGYIGYGLEMEKCVVTANTNIDDLIYLSPKSWRAVSREAGALYSHVLYRLPRFFITGNASDVKTAACLDSALNVIVKFFEKISLNLQLKNTKNVVENLNLIKREITKINHGDMAGVTGLEPATSTVTG